jgi:hypothetical protein
MGQVTSKLFGEVESGNGRASAIAPNMGIFIRKFYSLAQQASAPWYSRHEKTLTLRVSEESEA